MDAVDSQAKRENQLSDLDSLDTASLKALVLAKQTEIEHLKLLVLKLKRMHFGPRSEKRDKDIQQLELQLEDLEVSQAQWTVAPSGNNGGISGWVRAGCSVTGGGATAPTAGQIPVSVQAVTN